MQTRKIFFTLSFAVAACVIAAEVRAQTPNSIKVKEDKLPTVNYDARSQATPQRGSNKRKRKAFDSGPAVDEPHPEAGARGILDSWMQQLPAFPVDASDAIVIGDITNAQAYLAPGKMGVYSEYTARVDEVLKPSPASILTGGLVDAQREGGRVRFPSGRKSYIAHYQACHHRTKVCAVSQACPTERRLLPSHRIRAKRRARVSARWRGPPSEGATELPQFRSTKVLTTQLFPKL